eukprot:CAMPEP_0194392188 /NCGR_PEP_ID=MMETSP0174-20130528/120297_1 /TAXON_ID=216777 /ORGANISM="Proboscia alata, Strain PI-D3" /LENGTH=198 /DNA_ID=CAMNT_0039187307 /DNA_START=30 /DNA_END=626 /DNA_ORIENTATION=+
MTCARKIIRLSLMIALSSFAIILTDANSKNVRQGRKVIIEHEMNNNGDLGSPRKMRNTTKGAESGKSGKGGKGGKGKNSEDLSIPATAPHDNSLVVLQSAPGDSLAIPPVEHVSNDISFNGHLGSKGKRRTTTKGAKSGKGGKGGKGNEGIFTPATATNDESLVGLLSAPGDFPLIPPAEAVSNDVVRSRRHYVRRDR